MVSNELQEKDFIRKEPPRLLWIFLVLFIGITLLFWGLGKWQASLVSKRHQEMPFYQVTNREFSLFLWQNPAYQEVVSDLFFRNHHPIPEYADNYVSAPPEVIFRYHVWDRLLGVNSLAPRPIPASEFVQFLKENEEWLPEYWEEAPSNYKKMITESGDLADRLPDDVKLAFQGWKNTTHEWEQIEEVDTENLSDFLENHKTYRRSYWQNLVPSYLQQTFPDFLKMGVYNFREAAQKSSSS